VFSWVGVSIVTVPYYPPLLLVRCIESWCFCGTVCCDDDNVFIVFADKNMPSPSTHAALILNDFGDVSRPVACNAGGHSSWLIVVVSCFCAATGTEVCLFLVLFQLMLRIFPCWFCPVYVRLSTSKDVYVERPNFIRGLLSVSPVVLVDPIYVLEVDTQCVFSFFFVYAVSCGYVGVFGVWGLQGTREMRCRGLCWWFN
jgi:hypothetical protein